MNRIKITQSNKENVLPVADLALTTFFNVEKSYFKSIGIVGEVLPEDINPQYCDKVVASFTAVLDQILSGEKTAQERQRLQSFACPIYSLDNLSTLYENAKRRTVRERLASENKADVIAFHHALQDVTVWECKKVLEDRWYKVLD